MSLSNTYQSLGGVPLVHERVFYLQENLELLNNPIYRPFFHRIYANCMAPFPGYKHVEHMCHSYLKSHKAKYDIYNIVKLAENYKNIKRMFENEFQKVVLEIQKIIQPMSKKSSIPVMEPVTYRYLLRIMAYYLNMYTRKDIEISISEIIKVCELYEKIYMKLTTEDPYTSIVFENYASRIYEYNQETHWQSMEVVYTKCSEYYFQMFDEKASKEYEEKAIMMRNLHK